LFVGSPCAEEGTVGLLPHVSLSSVAPYLEQALESLARKYKAPMIVWKDFGEKESKQLEQLCASDNLFKVVSYPGTVVNLPPGQFGDYLKSLKSSHRHNLSKKLRRSKEQGELNASVIQHPDETILAEIFDLFWQTYEKGKTKFERLNPQFFRLIAQLDLSHFVLLRQPETGKLVAFMLCFCFEERVINKFIGIDYAQGPQWYMYQRLWEAAVDFAMSRSAKEFQSGQTGYRAKLDLGSRLVPLTNFCKHVNPLIRRVYAHIALDIQWSSLDDDLKVYLSAHPEGIPESAKEKELSLVAGKK
jgi:predicted N-acyltransferase